MKMKGNLQVREIQEDVRQQEEIEAAEQLANRLEQLNPAIAGQGAEPPLIDISLSADNERRRRRSSGSSLYSRSEADSDNRCG